MKILFTRFPLESIKNGGMEIQTVTLMQELIKRGHEVSFAGSCQALIEMCRERGIPTIVFDIGPPPVTKWHAISFFWRKRQMKKSLQGLLNQFSTNGAGIDVMILMSLSGKLLLTDLAAESGARVFWIEHDRVGPWLEKNPWFRTLLRESRKATTIVVSELSKNIYRTLGWQEDTLVAIPNGVTIPVADAAPKKKTKKEDMLHIGCISRLSSEKGVHVLIAAVAGLANVHLEIVGTGKDEDKLKGLVRASNVTDMVTFIDREKNVANVFSRIDVLVLPSREHDPFGLVAAEAMMAGVPVIVTDACGIASYLTDGKDAVIVEANSVEALRNAMERMQDSEYRKKIAAEGEKTAKRLFTVKRMVDEYEKTFMMS